MFIFTIQIVSKQLYRKFNSIHIYLQSAFHNTYHFKAALQKMHASTLQLRAICYQR